MLRQIAFGSTVSLANIAVHAMAMIVVIRVARNVASKWLSLATLRLGAVMIATVAVLMVAHMCEVAVWPLAYALVEATSEGAERLYSLSCAGRGIDCGSVFHRIDFHHIRTGDVGSDAVLEPPLIEDDGFRRLLKEIHRRGRA